jgi:hypothetical protein
VVGAALLAACSNDGDPDAASTTTLERAATTTTATAPERATSTTTTAFDPASVEGQVEAAYLRSWDVYAEAVYNLELDEAALTEVYAERSLDTRRNEIQSRIEDRRASLVRIDHEYQVAIVDSQTAAVVDHFVNHQVLIDPISKDPIESDPDERLLVNFQMKFIDGSWRVTLIQKVSP